MKSNLLVTRYRIHERAGWNAVTTNDPRTAANYGVSVANRKEEKHLQIDLHIAFPKLVL